MWIGIALFVVSVFFTFLLYCCLVAGRRADEQMGISDFKMEEENHEQEK